MKGLKTVYICSECGCVSPKWLGKCNQCGAWNSFVEDVVSAAPETLDDVLAELAAIEPEAEAAPAPSREVAMLDSEEAQHKKKPRHHPNHDNEKSRRPRTGREKSRHTAEPAANAEASER